MKMILRGMRLDTPEAQEAVRLGDIRARTNRKYSLQLLDEAARVALEVGPSEAARQTGVNVESIKKHAQRGKRANGTPARASSTAKYPDDVKRKVILAALRYRENTRSNTGECFRRAAINHGLDAKAGRSIQSQYQMGTFVP